MSEEKDIALRKKIADALIRARKIVADHKAEYHGIYHASGGGGTTSSNTTSTVPPQVLAEYNQVTGQANQVASAPLNQYGGQTVAGFDPSETSAFGTIDNMQGITAPYTQQASGLIGQATQNINPGTVGASQIQQYESPYTQQVLNSTVAEENNQDAQQQAQLQGNAISSGAWGGDRSAVAQGILGGQQALANNATNAGIENQGYSQALTEANTEQQAGLGAQEASQYLQESGGLAANQLGTSALNNTLSGANAQLESGQIQQQQAQAELNVPYENFLQQQAYPFQTTGWLGNIAEGIGSQEGGTSTSSTTQPSEGFLGLKRGGGIAAHYASGGSSGSGSSTGGAYTFDPESGTYFNDATPNSLMVYNIGDTLPAGSTVTASNAGNIPAGFAPAATPAPAAAPAPAANAFTAQTAPTYAQFVASGGLNAGIPYTGGIVSGMNANNQAELQNIYAGKYRKGGIVPHRDAGGVTPFTQTTNPMQNNATSNYSQMSLQQLQQLAQRMPPGTPQGAAVQAALKQKQFMPNVGNGIGGSTMARGGIVPKHYDSGGGNNDAVQAMTGYTLPDGTPDNQEHDYSSALPIQDITTNSEGLPAPTPPVNAPDHPANTPNYVPQMPSDHEANPWLSIAAGVLGTLAGRSRNPLVDIGQGGLIGLNNYASQQKEAFNQNYTEGSLQQNAQKLMDEADQHKQQFAQEKQNEADLNQYRQGELGVHQQELAMGKKEVIKDMFGNPTGIFDKTKGTFAPMNITGSSGSGASGANVLKDVDGTPLTPFQIFGYKNLITKQQPKDLAAENQILPSLVDQKTKVDDLVNRIPVASSGDLHTLQDFADRNQIPVFSDPDRAKATVLQNYDSMGNVLDNIRSTFGGTGRVLAKEFEGLQNELSVNKSASPEQKAVVVAHIQSRLNDLIQNENQRAQDIRSGKAYLPSYQSPEQQRLAKSISATPAPATAAPSAVIKYDVNGNRIQ